jgi:monofunctional biosynthetic peptidoglycan transglycosylase
MRRQARVLGRMPRALRLLGRSLRLVALGVLAAHWVLLVTVAAACLALVVTRPPATLLMAWRAVFQHVDLKPLRYVPLDGISRAAVRMLVALEDGAFYRHHGIDLAAIQNAIRVNKEVGRTMYGGSTITQQLARSLFLTTHRSYIRKYLEAGIAVALEAFLAKERILELYFNYVEWGPGVFGIGAAARYYYGKDVSKMSVDEYRRLVAILSSPVRYGVWTFPSSPLLAERYAYLVRVFPTP